jgi:DNA mismatch endonuclease (patch repair protein)
MPDVFTRAKRSEVMSKIRGRGNCDTELALVMLLRLHGVTGWRRNWPLFGKPDFVFPAHRIAIFVDGCFWHCCPRHSNIPSGNRKFWKAKLTANKARDRRVNRTLRKMGWHLIRIWEHDLARRRERCIQRIRNAIAKSS